MQCIRCDVSRRTLGLLPTRVCRRCTVAIISLRVACSDVYMYFTIGIIGFVFVVIFNVMASVVFVQVLLKTLSQKMKACNYSFDYYGMFWGISAIL